MNAFALATDSMFEDHNHGLDSVFRSGGAGDGAPARVILRAPDGVASFGERRFVVETFILKVRLSEVAEPVAGDTFTIGTDAYEVHGAPARDALRLVWTCEVRAL